LAVRKPTADDPMLLIATERISPGALAFDPERSPTDTAKIIVRITLGMAYLHSHGVLHRDLKPANILVDQAMRPRICDFGLSKICDTTQTQSRNPGTSLYMAPEVYTDDCYGPSVDIFAWACTAYEFITGKYAMEGRGLFQVANAAISGARQPIPDEWGSEFADVMKRAWAVKPNERPSFLEILDVFRKCSYQLWREVDSRAVCEFVSDIERRATAP
jgi:serine/threonine protein kinase